jgi:hypothetical protein
VNICFQVVLLHLLNSENYVGPTDRGLHHLFIMFHRAVKCLCVLNLDMIEHGAYGGNQIYVVAVFLIFQPHRTIVIFWLQNYFKIHVWSIEID